MICKSCGAENKDWASYCIQCGVPLGDVCRCSFINEPGNLFCGGCGRPLLSSKNQSKNNNNAPSIIDPATKPLSETQVKKLIKESMLLKVDEDESISQQDIDLMFTIENNENNEN